MIDYEVGTTLIAAKGWMMEIEDPWYRYLFLVVFNSSDPTICSRAMALIGEASGLGGGWVHSESAPGEVMMCLDAAIDLAFGINGEKAHE